jgi:hypothetical protein
MTPPQDTSLPSAPDYPRHKEFYIPTADLHLLVCLFYLISCIYILKAPDVVGERDAIQNPFLFLGGGVIALERADREEDLRFTRVETS